MTENNTTKYLLIINDGPYGNERPVQRPAPGDEPGKA
jgi:hypothetical protein